MLTTPVTAPSVYLGVLRTPSPASKREVKNRAHPAMDRVKELLSYKA